MDGYELGGDDKAHSTNYLNSSNWKFPIVDGYELGGNDKAHSTYYLNTSNWKFPIVDGYELGGDNKANTCYQPLLEVGQSCLLGKPLKAGKLVANIYFSSFLK